jgi:hypothetical protein
MGMKNWAELAPYVDEAEKILRQKFKFSAERAQELLSRALWAIAKQPEVEKLKNPRRILLSTVRKVAAKERREEKEWAIRNRNH